MIVRNDAFSLSFSSSVAARTSGGGKLPFDWAIASVGPSIKQQTTTIKERNRILFFYASAILSQAGT
ncbi:hypothetical protein [Caenibius tardaugens]|uniref:hypothetical protein n=1 Tax=Caenibius tardaugens TaxID=169176 RepID=UPI00137592EF|nr:hypothetical protein [Caenibius tardaugens]